MLLLIKINYIIFQTIATAKTMLNPLKSKSKQASESSAILAIQVRDNTKIINLVGYVFLILTFLDLVHLLIHPQFFNPQWEMRTMGKTIETVWAILLGFILIFYRSPDRSIKLQELQNLSRLSWLALFLGIFYLLMIPLLANDARIIAKNNRIQSQQQIQQQTLQFKQFEQKLTNSSDAKLTQFLQPNNSQKFSIESPEKLRDKLINSVREKRDRIEKQLNKQLQAKQINLIKITIKWMIGAIISGVSFILMWKWTKSIRISAVKGDREL